MKTNFANITYHQIVDGFERNELKVEGKHWDTLEKIAVQPLYTAKDLVSLTHLDYAAGLPPFARGPYSTMYVMRPWTVRQYSIG